MKAQDLIKKLRLAIRKGWIKGTSEIGAIVFDGETTEVVKLDTVCLPKVPVNELIIETAKRKVDLIFYDSNISYKGRNYLFPGADVEQWKSEHKASDVIPKSTDTDEELIKLLQTKE